MAPAWTSGVKARTKQEQIRVRSCPISAPPNVNPASTTPRGPTHPHRQTYPHASPLPYSHPVPSHSGGVETNGSWGMAGGGKSFRPRFKARREGPVRRSSRWLRGGGCKGRLPGAKAASLGVAGRGGEAGEFPVARPPTVLAMRHFRATAQPAKSSGGAFRATEGHESHARMAQMPRLTRHWSKIPVVPARRAPCHYHRGLPLEAKPGRHRLTTLPPDGFQSAGRRVTPAPPRPDGSSSGRSPEVPADQSAVIG